MPFEDYVVRSVPTAPAPVRPARPTPRRSSRPPRGPSRTTAVIVAALIAGAVVAAWKVLPALTSQPSSSGSSAKTVAFTAPAPGLAQKLVCLDKSGSINDKGQLADIATTGLISALGSLHVYPKTVPTYESVAPVRGVDMWVRVIEKNSFETSTTDSNTVHVSIPSVGGLTSAEPQPVDSNYAADDFAYQQASYAVAVAGATATKAQAVASKSLKVLARETSTGSDISGCASALLQVPRTAGPRSMLIISDLEDTLPRPLTGHFAGTTLTVIQACPSGDPVGCAKVLARFETNMAALGATKSQIQVFRPEGATATIKDWLRS